MDDLRVSAPRAPLARVTAPLAAPSDPALPAAAAAPRVGTDSLTLPPKKQATLGLPTSGRPPAPAPTANTVPAYQATFGAQSYVKNPADAKMLALFKQAAAKNPTLAAGPVGQAARAGALDPAAVKSMQSFLQAQHLDVGATGADGKFGPKTHAALAAFLSASPAAAAGPAPTPAVVPPAPAVALPAPPAAVLPAPPAVALPAPPAAALPAPPAVALPAPPAAALPAPPAAPQPTPAVAAVVTPTAAPADASLQAIADKLQPQLPPGVTVKPTATGLEFSRDGRGFYAAHQENGAWSSGGYRQDGLRGHPDSPAVVRVLEANGMATPRTAAPAPPAPLPAPTVTVLPPSPPAVAPPQPPAQIAAPAPTPVNSPYQALATKLQSQLPAGVTVQPTADGLSFSRDGRSFYSARVQDGQWTGGGMRQDGLRGHPDTPAVVGVLRANGLLPPPTVAAPPPPPTPPQTFAVTPAQAANFGALAGKLQGQVPAGVTVAALPNGVSFSAGGRVFYEATAEDGQWHSGGMRQDGIFGHPMTPAAVQALAANGMAAPRN